MNIVACKVCGNTNNNEIFSVREMYLGLRENFLYQKCGNCGLMQLLDIPKDLAKYYPLDKYYSLKNEEDKNIRVEFLRKIKANYLLYNKNKFAGSLMSIGYKIPEYYEWLKKGNIQFEYKILDVGCGNGGLLKSLNKIGFTNLTGIDPFNDKDLFFGDIKIYKKNLFEMEGKYDFIMLNHVFEHLDEPQKVIKKLYNLLDNGKYLLIRTPVMNTYAWNIYSTDWMSLDAPRHLIIHTVKSIQLLCDMSGFKLDDVVFDSTEDGLVGSEQYKKDVALNDPGSFFHNRKTALFSKEKIDELKQIGKEKNITGNGDQAAFYLYKP